MKWFKHETKRQAALKRIIMEFGIEGYGLYWLCIELIAGDISIDNLTFELHEDAELIAHEFNMDTIKVEKIMHRCIELGLFDLSDNGRIRCLTLAKMLDESITKNATVRQMKSKIINKLDKYSYSGDIPECLRRPSDQKRIEENRIEEKRKEEKRFKKPSLSELNDYISTREIKIDADKFYNFYESKGWMVGSNKMKNWKSAVITWERKEIQKKDDGRGKNQKYIEEMFKNDK